MYLSALLNTTVFYQMRNDKKAEAYSATTLAVADKYPEVLAIPQVLLGTIEMLHNQADSYITQNNLPKAEIYYLQALKLGAKIYPPDSKTMIIIQNKLQEIRSRNTLP